MFARLTRSADFSLVFEHGRFLANRGLVLYWFCRPEGPARIGFCVGRKLGKAVRRNRIKRLLKENWRTLAEEVATPADLVFVARTGGVGFSLDDWNRAMTDLLRRAGLIGPRSVDA